MRFKKLCFCVNKIESATPSVMARGEQLPSTSTSVGRTPRDTCRNIQKAVTDLMAQEKPPSPEMILKHVSPSPQAADQLPPVKRLVFLAEITYTGIEPQVIAPLKTTLATMSHASTWDIPCPRFKQWTADEAGLEFTLGVTIPCMPPNFVFGPYNDEQERVEMVRCVTADLVQDKYAVITTVGDVYRPTETGGC